MASGASVTVSIAADTIGMLRVIFGVRRAAVLTSPGRTLDSAGRSRTSSNVSPSLANFGGKSWPGAHRSPPRFPSPGKGLGGVSMERA